MIAALAPRISVVIPTHHRPEMLRALFDSLTRQTYARHKFEILVVASSGDPGCRIVHEFPDLDARCVELTNDRWRGRSAAAKRNRGVREARGDWIAFIDDDCQAHPDWLAGASGYLDNPGIVAVEGAKEIPKIDPPTLTYKGLLSFTRPGGFQTCNMFYRRDVFLAAGGFDTRFPFYLEDSDLAWTLLDQGQKIPFAPAARVVHPVSRSAPWRLIDDARRTALLPLLRRKHPAQYRLAGLRALRMCHWAYLVCYLGILVSAAVAAWQVAGLFASLTLALVMAHATKLFRGCRFEAGEVALTAALLPAVPLVRLLHYVRGVLRYSHGCKLWE